MNQGKREILRFFNGNSLSAKQAKKWFDTRGNLYRRFDESIVQSAINHAPRYIRMQKRRHRLLYKQLKYKPNHSWVNAY